jgi:hypothetical protein
MQDLDDDAVSIYLYASELYQSADTDTGKAAALRTMLGVLRYRSELREKAQVPAQLKELRSELGKVQSIVKASHGTGNANRGAQSADGPDNKPAWRVSTLR